MARFLVTGGAGFIGSAVALRLIDSTDHQILVVDKLTYAGNIKSLAPAWNNPRFRFVRADICDAPLMQGLIEQFQPDAIMNLAAESHVDRSIDSPGDFIQTNVVGSFALLQAALKYWRQLSPERKAAFRFHHVSTDEVFGSLGQDGQFTEATPYQPNSPYSASKAASDHLVRAWYHTYGLPTTVSNCSNNYGPRHFPEKLIPLLILNAFEGKPLPIYGDGSNIRDWLYVEDHAAALILISERGVPGDSYVVGGQSEHTNLQVAEAICEMVDSFVPDERLGSRRRLISFVADRPGHDFRYSIDATKIKSELGWLPNETFESGLFKTIAWYRDNRDWWEPIRSQVYQGERLGTKVA